MSDCLALQPRPLLPDTPRNQEQVQSTSDNEGSRTVKLGEMGDPIVMPLNFEDSGESGGPVIIDRVDVSPEVRRRQQLEDYCITIIEKPVPASLYAIPEEMRKEVLDCLLSKSLGLSVLDLLLTQCEREYDYWLRKKSRGVQVCQDFMNKLYEQMMELLRQMGQMLEYQMWVIDKKNYIKYMTVNEVRRAEFWAYEKRVVAVLAKRGYSYEQMIDVLRKDDFFCSTLGKVIIQNINLYRMHKPVRPSV